MHYLVCTRAADLAQQSMWEGGGGHGRCGRALNGLVPSYNNDVGGPLMSIISRLIVRSFDFALFHSGSPRWLWVRALAQQLIWTLCSLKQDF